MKNDFSLWFSMKGSTKSPSQNSPAGVARGGHTKNSQSPGISKKSWHFQDWFGFDDRSALYDKCDSQYFEDKSAEINIFLDGNSYE